MKIAVYKKNFFIHRTTGSPGSKSPAGVSGGLASATSSSSSQVVGPGGEPRTPTAGPQNKQLANVKGDHPSVSIVRLIYLFLKLYLLSKSRPVA